jgi:regulator of cell morphogenesis and NO signaling
MNKFVFKSSDNIGDIAKAFPKSMEVFKAYNIDFCCGGNRALKQVVKEQGVDENEVMDKLQELYNNTLNTTGEEVDFTKLSYSELIDYIVNTHHAYLQIELPKVAELTTKILRVHGANHSELLKVHKLLASLKSELEEHLIKEEEIEFPLIKEYEKNPSKELLDKVKSAIKELEQEHEGAGDILKELRKVTNGFEVPEDGCNSYRLTYNKLREIEDDTFKHIHLENNIMFPSLMDK